MIYKQYLKGSLNPLNLFSVLAYKRNFKKEHPDYFWPDGLLTFCGSQGKGKTLSAVQYCRKILEDYPKCKFYTNVDIKDLPYPDRVFEYTGLDCLKDENGEYGILYLIDEIHLEWNSLESKNITIEEMTEFAQQRKQRKHIVGTSQVFTRIAKPLREQMKYVVLCKNFASILQFNTLIDGDTVVEKDGEMSYNVLGHSLWFHTPALYQSYDTYAKMKRYKKEWQGHPYDPTRGGSR